MAAAAPAAAPAVETAPLEVLLPGGKRVDLPAQESAGCLILGRAQAAGPSRSFVSREQLVLRAGGGGLVVRVVGLNSSSVLDASGSERRVLSRGDEDVIHPGEAVCLLGRLQPVRLETRKIAPIARTPGAAVAAAAAAAPVSEPASLRPLWPGPFRPIAGPTIRGGLSALQQLVARARRGERDAAVLYADEAHLVLYDAFPKSEVHLLIVSTHQALFGTSPLAFTAVQLAPLRELAACAQWMERSLRHLGSLGPDVDLLVGFHAVPSIRPTHLHLVSGDFRGRGLKTRKHWNSFHTDFFLRLSDVVLDLQEGRSIARRFAEAGDALVAQQGAQQRLKGTMRCAVCANPEELVNMAAVFAHVHSDAHRLAGAWGLDRRVRSRSACEPAPEAAAVPG